MENKKIKYDNLTAIEYSNPKLMNDYGYKYVIGWLGSGMCQAYRTDEGFKRFLKIYNLKIDHTEEKESYQYEGEKIKIYYFKPVIITEKYFWNIEDVQNMNAFVGLSNGSYVVCYYKHIKNGSIIMRPNPNAKNVYTELDYREMEKIWG